MPKDELVLSPTFVNYKISRENQRLFINSQEIIGAESIQISTITPCTPIMHMGMLQPTTLLSTQPLGNVTIQSLLVNRDPFISLMNASGCTGYLISSQRLSPNQNRIQLGFLPAYLSSYSLRYSDGQIPTLNTVFNCYDRIGQLNDFDANNLAADAGVTGSTPNYNLLIPSRGSINLSLNEFTTNRVLGFDLNLTINREPLYSIGNIIPYATRIVNPILIQGSFQLEVGDYHIVNLQSIIVSKVTRNLTITVSDYKSSTVISSYGISGVELTSQSYLANANGNTVVNLEYRGYVNVQSYVGQFSSLPVNSM